jgi:acetolactate synthase-1/2/3 large subunit
VVKIADAFGAKGVRAETPDEVGPVIEKGLAAEGPVIMEFMVCQEALVYPMVPAGIPLGDMLPYAEQTAEQKGE